MTLIAVNVAEQCYLLLPLQYEHELVVQCLPFVALYT
jgi:hypothetical protein